MIPASWVDWSIAVLWVAVYNASFTWISERASETNSASKDLQCQTFCLPGAANAAPLLKKPDNSEIKLNIERDIKQ